MKPTRCWSVFFQDKVRRIKDPWDHRWSAINYVLTNLAEMFVTGLTSTGGCADDSPAAALRGFWNTTLWEEVWDDAQRVEIVVENPTTKGAMRGAVFIRGRVFGRGGHLAMSFYVMIRKDGDFEGFEMRPA